MSGSESIFPGLLGSTGQMAANPAAGALTGWAGTTSEGDAYEIALTTVQAVPEPQTLALMLAGLVFCGAVARRKQAR